MGVPVDEKPKKHSVGSGTSYICLDCEHPDSGRDLYSYAEVKKHYSQTQHAILITTYFNSVFGTEEQADNSNDNPNDYM